MKKTKILTRLLKSSHGQTLVEYLLVLVSAAAFLVMVGIYFHKQLLGRFFQIVGMIIGD